jgi:PH domain associated with Beige/BEACH
LHGIRLSDSRLKGIGGNEYASCLRSDGSTDQKRESEIDRRLCVALSAQMLTLLDSFIFPDALDAALPGAQLDGLALVRFSEPRLGTAQGPLISAAIRLSIPLLALLEPCSITFLQCSSRLRCLLCWALELLREHSTPDVHPISFHVDGDAHLDRLILAVTLHCHRALGRCSSLLWEIENASPEKYFHSRDSQKKYHRRLLRVALELRDVVSTAYRGRNDLLLSTLSTDSFEALRVSLEGDSTSDKSSKESVVREFLSSSWVAGFTDIVYRHDIVVPEQVSMETIPLSSEDALNPHSRGFFTVEKLANESKTIVSDFETAINSCFEEYLQGQRAWAETDAVRDLEYDGNSTSKRLSENYKIDNLEFVKAMNLRKNVADSRWRAVHTKVVEPWKNEIHWKLAKYTDILGRRTVLVQNREFCDHSDASYDLAMGKEREKEEIERQKRLFAKNDLTDVIRRNAAAFIVEEALSDSESRDDGSLQLKSDGDSTADIESSTDGDSIDNVEAYLVQDSVVHEGNVDHDEGWDKIDTEEIKDVDDEGGTDSWATAFIWAESESIVARFEPVTIVSLQTFVEGKVLLTTHGLYFHQFSEEINAITREAVENVEGTGVDTKDKRWRLARLTEVHGRRFMHRHQAIELFFSDNHELLLNFPGGWKDRDRFHSKLRHNCKVRNNSIALSFIADSVELTHRFLQGSHALVIQVIESKDNISKIKVYRVMEKEKNIEFRVPHGTQPNGRS